MTPAVSFIPPRRRQLRRLRVRGRTWAGVCAGLALILGAVSGALVAQGDEPDGGVGAELARAREQLERETRRSAEIEARISRDGAGLARVRAIGRHPDWSVLLRALAAARGGDVVLERVSIAESGRGREGARPSAEPTRAGGAPGALKGADAFTVRVAGQARTQEFAAAYTRRLEELGVFDRVRIVETRLVNVQGREFASFQVECSLGPRRVSAVDAGKAGAP